MEKNGIEENTYVLDPAGTLPKSSFQNFELDGQIKTGQGRLPYQDLFVAATLQGSGLQATCSVK